MFYKSADAGFTEALKGITMKTLVHGDKTLVVEFRLRRGSILPVHKHPHEQTGYLVSGKLRMSIGKEEYDVGKGDSWNITGDMEHGAVAVEDSVAVEVFSPVREDYLTKNIV
jgi:quercetin dioxygenase-like cupin family protein